MSIRIYAAIVFCFAASFDSTVANADGTCTALFDEIRRWNKADSKNRYNVYWTTNYFNKTGLRFMGRAEGTVYSAQTAEQPGGHERDLVIKGTRSMKGHPHDQPKLGDRSFAILIDNHDKLTFDNTDGRYDPTCSGAAFGGLPSFGNAVIHSGDSIEVFNFMPTLADNPP
jgi:hypothetical protein